MMRAACLSFALTVLGCAHPPDESSQLFAKAKTLIESNCAGCPQHSQSELEEGISLALKARDAGYRDRVAILRLLVDAHATLGGVVLKLGDPKRDDELGKSTEFLKQLVEAAPKDPNVRYELIHRKVGNVESKMADIDERIPQLRQVLALDPKHEKARFDLALDLFQKGEDDEAISIMRGLAGSADPELSRNSVERLQQFLAGGRPQIVAPVQFAGEVSRGGNFEREFAPGLVFGLQSLDSTGTGWTIEIHRKESPAEEYLWVMTPPYHFQNVRYLSLEYGQTATQIVDKHARGFRFVRTRADYVRAAANVEVVLGHVTLADEREAQAARERALKDMEKIPYCTGFFRVLDSRLARAENGTEVVDWMKFQVDLCTKQRG